MSSSQLTFIHLMSCFCCKHKRVSVVAVSIVFFTSCYFLSQYFGIEHKANDTYVVKKEDPMLTTIQPKMDSTFHIQYKLVHNLEESYYALISITNTANVSIKGQAWTLYFCSITPIQVEQHPKFRLHHINGCLHKIQPATEAIILGAGETINFYHYGKEFIGGRTHVMPNWYLIGPDNHVRIVQNTVGEDLSFVEDFKSEIWKRYPSDKYDSYSPQKRYDVIGFDAPKGVGDSPLLVLPQPMYVDDLDRAKRLNLDMGWRVQADKVLNKEAQVLQARFKIPVEYSSSPTQAKVISLKIGNPGVKVNGVDSTNHEAYLLRVDTADQTIRVVGNSPEGVFYGIQTLLSIVDEADTVPEVSIQDAPRYSYRGMHLDVGRNFMSKSAVLRLLDVMAMYKMNKFHFHLTDDEGWRLQIPGLPELTEVGARRCHDLTETKCIQPELGALPQGSPAAYFSVKDYREILDYANVRHIQVIPEFDMPGHGHAAIKSMEVRYKNLKRAGDANAEQFLLVHLNDTSKYQSVQQFNDNVINPCLESTYNFISRVLESVMRMHSGIQPLTVYHFGGDEVPEGVWEGSMKCDEIMLKYQGQNRKATIKEYFIRRLAKITAHYGLQLAGWADAYFKSPDQGIVYERESFENKELLVNAWNNANITSRSDRAYVLANAGYKVIMTQATHFYFDHPYEPDPEERGNNWATPFTDTQKVFGFMPEGVYDNSGVKCSSREKEKCLQLTKKENIIGMSAALWTELVRNQDQMDSMVFPRLLAFAERAWHKASWEDIKDTEKRNEKMRQEWEKFSHFIVKHELPRLDKLDIKYHLPLPGARFEGKRIKVRTALPGLPVKYSKNGGKTWHDVTKRTEITGKVHLTTWSTDRRRMSRIIQVQSPFSD